MSSFITLNQDVDMVPSRKKRISNYFSALEVQNFFPHLAADAKVVQQIKYVCSSKGCLSQRKVGIGAQNEGK